MSLGDTPTGKVVNGARVGITLAGVAAVAIALVALALLLFSSASMGQDLIRLYAIAALFAGGLLLLRVAKNFSMHSSLIPDVLYQGLKVGKTAAELESMVRTLEAHIGGAAFFSRLLKNPQMTESRP